MTKKKQEVAVVEEEKANLPAFLQRTDSVGANMDTSDLTLPRIKVAQSLTPEVKDGVVSDGSLFLNVTGEVLAEPGQPLRFILLGASKEYILWRHRKDQGGGLLARAKETREGSRIRYKWDKPNTSFEVKAEGVKKVTWETEEYVDQDRLDAWGTSMQDLDSPPAAQVHYNYLVMLPDHGNMVAAFSLSRSGVKRARDLNSMVALSPIDCHGRFFTAKTEAEKSPSGEYFGVRFRPAGTMDASQEDLFRLAKKQAAFFDATGYNIAQDQDDEPEGGRSKKDAEAF